MAERKPIIIIGGDVPMTSLVKVLKAIESEDFNVLVINDDNPEHVAKAAQELRDSFEGTDAIIEDIRKIVNNDLEQSVYRAEEFVRPRKEKVPRNKRKGYHPPKY